jgi:hypothetical protein
LNLVKYNLPGGPISGVHYTLRQGLDADRQIAEVVQGLDMIHGDGASTERGVHTPLVLLHDLRFGLVEELGLPSVDKEVLDEVL